MGTFADFDSHTTIHRKIFFPLRMATSECRVGVVTEEEGLSLVGSINALYNVNGGLTHLRC